MSIKRKPVDTKEHVSFFPISIKFPFDSSARNFFLCDTPTKDNDSVTEIPSPSVLISSRSDTGGIISFVASFDFGFYPRVMSF